MEVINIDFPRYSAYQPSGVEWLGEIPEHWNLTRLGSYFHERKTKVSDKDFSPLSVTKNGVVPQLDSAAKSNDGDNRKLVKGGDFVINSRSDRKGSSGIATEDGSVSLINIVMKPVSIYPDFSNYLLKSNAFVEENYRIGHGIVADLWTTRYDEMKNIKIGVPPIHEQSAIAAFLDYKTAKIDQAIAQKEKLIALLKERKQIIIQDLVTGKKVWNAAKNDWTVPDQVQDSGVEWIGEIPEGWEVISLKWLTKIYAGGTPDKTNLSYWENGTIPWISSGEVNQEFISKPTTYISKRGFLNSSANWIPKDALVVALAGQGKTKGMVAYLNIPTTGNQSLAAVIPKRNRIAPLFLFYSLKASYQKLRGDAGEGKRDGLNLSILGDLKIVCPRNVLEQVEISEFIINESNKSDKAIWLQQIQIDKLKEYKATLIDSAVTGKIKVT